MTELATEAAAPPTSTTAYPRLNPFTLLVAIMGALGLVLAVWLVKGVHVPQPHGAIAEKAPDAVAPWALEIFGWALWVAVWAGGIRSVIRNRRLTPWVLCLIASQTMWWQEWYADWGGYLQYSDSFKLIPWGSTVFTSPNKPWILVAVYGWYFQLMPYMLHKVQWVLKRYPQLPRTTTIVVLGGFMFYLENLVFEGIGATQLGWWSYVQHWGPSFNWANGTWPLFGPAIIFTVFGIVVIWMMDQTEPDGTFKLDVLSGVTRVREGWRRETARAVAWTFTFNALYILTLLVPLIAIRVFVYAKGSYLVP